MRIDFFKCPLMRGVLCIVLCFAGVGYACGEEYELITSVNELVAGDRYIIASMKSGDGFVMAKYVSKNDNCKEVAATVRNSRISYQSGMARLILGDADGKWTLYDGTYYMTITEAEGNYLKGSQMVDKYAKFSISFDDTGSATITCEKEERYYLRYNSGAGIFSCYKSDSQSPVYLYKEVIATNKEVTSIAITGTPSTTTYYVGDTPSADGLSVVATYSDASTENVTNRTEWQFSPVNIETNTSSITATAKYEGISASITYNITLKSIANTPENAYTVAQAYSIINAGRGLAEEVYVKGIVSQVGDITDGHLTYWISDDGLTSKTFRCFQGLGIEAEKFNSNADLKVGSRVVVKGLLQKVNGVCGFKENNILNECKALASIAIEGNATKTSYFVDEKPDASGLTVIAKYSDESSFDVTQSATWSFLPQTISKNTTEVQAVASYLNKTANCSFPISVKEVVYDLIPLEGETSVYDSPNPTGIYIEGVTWFVKGVSDEVPWKIGGKEIEEATDRSIYCSTPVYGTIDEVIVSVGESSGDIEFHKLSLIVTDKNENTIGTLSQPSPQPNNEYAFDLTNLSEMATDCYYKIVYNISVDGESNKYIEFCGAKFVGTPAQYLIPVEQEYATLCLPYNVAVPEGVVAYSASENGEYIRLTPIPDNIIAANEGVVLKAPSGEYPFTSTYKQATRNADNLMIGVTKDTPLTASDKAYMLTRKKEDGSIAFRLLNTDYTLGANKAYLKLSDGNNARDVISVQWDDCETGIIEPQSKGKDNEIVIYNLSGQKMKQTQKGINIINGKLVVR